MWCEVRSRHTGSSSEGSSSDREGFWRETVWAFCSSVTVPGLPAESALPPRKRSCVRISSLDVIIKNIDSSLLAILCVPRPTSPGFLSCTAVRIAQPIGQNRSE